MTDYLVSVPYYHHVTVTADSPEEIDEDMIMEAIDEKYLQFRFDSFGDNWEVLGEDA